MKLKLLLLAVFLIPALERMIFTFKHREGKGKVKHVWTSIFLISSYLVSVSLAIFDFFVCKKNINIFFTILGLLVMSVGIILRNSSVKTLGDNWSIHIKDISGQQLIRAGAYSLIRHPYYVAVIFEITGVAFYFNSLLSSIYILLIHFPLLLVRIMLEEKELDRKFNDQFKKYQQEVGAFLPQ